MSVATSACVVCHQKKPRTEMVQVEKTERSGHSNGGGMSWSGGKNKNPRYFGSRRHYHRVRKEWWCKSCYQAKLDEPAPWYVWPILWVVFIYVGYGVGVFAEDMIFQNDGQYSDKHTQAKTYYTHRLVAEYNDTISHSENYLLLQALFLFHPQS